MGLRLFHTLALTLAVATALAAGASAAFLDAEVEEFPVGLIGEETTEQVFSFESGWTAKCKNASFSGSLAEASKSFSLAPSYSECTAFGLNATVTATGCKYTFQIGEENESKKFPSTADIACEAGKAIKITTATCEVTITGQTGLGTVELSNTASEPIEASVELAVANGMAYTKVKDGIGCPLSGTGAKTDGGLSGSSLVEGEQLGIQKWLQLGRTVLCTEAPGANNKCAAKKEYAAGKVLTGTTEKAPELKVTYEKGGAAKEFIVTCKSSTMTVKTTAAEAGVVRGLPANLESLTFQECKEPGGEECPIVELNAVNGAKLRPSAAGNGKVALDVKFRVVCAAMPFNCEYAASLSLAFTGGNEAKIETPGLKVKFLKAITNCAVKEATWTGVYKTNVAAWLAH